MTIPKNTRKAKQAIEHATNIRCYSLSSGFSGHPISLDPVMWQNGLLIHVSPAEFLINELKGRHCKLSVMGNGKYCLHVHSNLWYEFDVA